MGQATGIYHCPACSRSITFRGDTTRLRVCACGQVLRRNDDDQLILSHAYLLNDPNDWVQIGTTGAFANQAFEVLGRFRVWLEESVYNYWTIRFDDGHIAWLAEGYGMYAIVRSVNLDRPISIWDVDHLRPEDSLDDILGSHYWYIQRKDSCWKWEIDGEVWMPDAKDQFRLFDVYARGDAHLEIIEFQPDKPSTYAVTYVEYADLNLANLHEAPVRPMEVTCTECHKTITVKTFPYAQSVSCTCGARQVFKHADGFRASKKDPEDENAMDIPLGSTGTIKGIPYEVIGYSLKEEDSAEAPRWKEYVLHNRAEGYAFLSEYKGSWIYTRECGNSPVLGRYTSTDLRYKDREFELYNRYTIRLIDTAGEFPFNIFDDQEIVSAEFISPPYMWVYEKSREDGIDWFFGQYIDRKEVAAAFNAELPEQEEHGILDPHGTVNIPGLLKVTGVAVALLLLVHFLIGGVQGNRTVFEGDLQLRDTVASSTFVSPPFTLNKWRSNLRFDLSSPVDNNWLDMDASLVNTATGKEEHLSSEISYYHGYDDGYWSEGSTKQTEWLSAVPAGTYQLRIEASRDTVSSRWDAVKDMTVKVTNDAPMQWNLWIFLSLLLVWPLAKFVYYQFNERKRWSKSPFSPFTKTDSTSY